MMIKVFQKNKNGKIQLSFDELENLLNEAYWEGYRANNAYVYKTPNQWSPYYTTTTASTITIDNNNEPLTNGVKITC